MRSLTVCAELGCHELVERGRCASHRLPGKRNQRGDAHNDRRWKKRSIDFRRRNASCVACGEAAHHVDHVIGRDVLVAAGIHDPDHDRWLQALCIRCHSSKTKVVDDRYLERLAAGEDAERLCEYALEAASEWLTSRRSSHWVPRDRAPGAGASS